MINISIKDGKMDAYVTGTQDQLIIELLTVCNLIDTARDWNEPVLGEPAKAAAQICLREALAGLIGQKFKESMGGDAGDVDDGEAGVQRKQSAAPARRMRPAAGAV